MPDVVPSPLREQIAHLATAAWLDAIPDDMTAGEVARRGYAVANAVLPLVEAARLAERERIARADVAIGELIDQRDDLEKLLDEFLSLVPDMGEHSNMNDPWRNALEWLREHGPVAERERLHAQLRDQIERLPSPVGLPGLVSHVAVLEWIERLLGVAATPQPEEPTDAE